MINAYLKDKVLTAGNNCKESFITDTCVFLGFCCDNNFCTLFKEPLEIDMVNYDSDDMEDYHIRCKDCMDIFK